MIHTISSIMSLACIAAALIIVSRWAKSGENGYLGVPNWETNKFAWHPG